jgi:hypothetical protein
VLLRGVDAEDAGLMAERILTDLVRPVQVGEHTLVVRASIGVAPATAPPGGDDLEGLLRNADIAMYAAKNAGKGGFQRYAPDMAARIRRRPSSAPGCATPSAPTSSSSPTSRSSIWRRARWSARRPWCAGGRTRPPVATSCRRPSSCRPPSRPA